MGIFRKSICCLLVAFPMGGFAQDSNGERVGSQLPAEVRGLLIQEMLAVLSASKDILEAMVRGEHATVAERAQAIHDSFIMNQQMTEENRAALQAAVPEAFLRRDSEFHELSAELAAAAREEDSAAQQQLFSRMQQACVECHSNHAKDRFPRLTNLE